MSSSFSQAIDNALSLFYEGSWTRLFKGKYFDDYREYIENKIDAHRKSRREERMKLGINDSKELEDGCNHTFWDGEFGMEMRVFVPWAHYKSRHKCKRLQTHGVVGSKYMYYFSDEHIIHREAKRHSIRNGLPPGNPFGADNVHIRSFPKDADWEPPNFKQFFQRPEMVDMFDSKPLVILQNKYTLEWKEDPTNFYSVSLLRKLFKYLTPKYTIVYRRETAKAIQDHQDTDRLDLGEMDMIRKEFPSVVLYQDLQEGLTDPEDQNLLLFGLMSLSKRFLSVQGGTAVISSFFGGSNSILIKWGVETDVGDYNYFHRFSNATIAWKEKNGEFIDHIKSIM
uniref:Uncharacterized protein n=1 Tax=Entomoneis paludosa TaxID=265537 RepID=A0A7S3DSD4_9STRA|mmetsp:Transcript_33123/g.68977  ORF Transcript_33123/g.68977 Transcript_33123/m.68977 type:complete len:339 (+) Transcript_33123:267-1283(+)